MENIAYKFVDWEISEVGTLKNTFPYLMTTKLRRGEELSRAEKNRLYEELQHNSYSKKGIPLQGWMFDFGQWLKEYFIEFTYGQIEKVWAIDKTSIRAYEHNIKRIVEIDNNF